MKKKWLKILPIILVLVIVSPFLVKQYEDYMYKKNFKDNGKNEPYSLGIPLHEMDFSVYRKYFPGEAPVGVPYQRSILLPCDVEYYQNKNDADPIMTLKKGTEVYVLGINGINVRYGYAYKCWPDYDSEWRYGYPFFTSDFSVFPAGLPMYYVKLKQLEDVARVFYKENIEICSRSATESEYVSKITRQLDNILYRAGAFCAPRD